MMDMENMSPSSASSGEMLTSSSPPSAGFYNCVYQPSRSTIQGLPKQFVRSMRTLFDILDDTKSGLVPLVEIERRWRDDAVPNLPGVLGALRAVAPPDGLLSFENFVCGLRVALTRARKGDFSTQSKHRNSTLQRSERNGLISSIPTGSSAPFQPFHRSQVRNANIATVTPSWSQENPTTATYKPRPPLPARPLQCRENDPSHAPRGRPFRSHHRRSNSGPITTAKVLPHVQNPPASREFETQDDIKLEKSKNKGDYVMKIASDNADDIRKISDDFKYSPIAMQEGENGLGNQYCSNEKISTTDNKVAKPIQRKNGSRERLFEDKTNLIKPEFGSAESIRHKSDLDHITASTLCINKEAGSPSLVSVQPVILSGKYIGITGTLKRTKSSACISQNQYGSLRRKGQGKDGDSPPQVTSMSATCFSTLGRPGSSGRNAKIVMDRKMTRSQNSKTDPNDVLSGISNADRKRAMERSESSYRNHYVTLRRPIDAGSDGSGRRCNSASPPERPAVKSARSSDSPDQMEIPKLSLSSSLSSPESNLSRSATSPNMSSESEPRQLYKPPPPGRGSNPRSVPPSDKNQDRSLSSSCISSSTATTERRRRANSASSVNRRRDPRRHTVTTGIDYNLLKCMKQLEEEKDLLTKGLESLDRAKKWFEHQLADLKTRQDDLNTGLQSSSFRSNGDSGGKNQGSSSWSSTQQENSQKKIDSLVSTVAELEKMAQNFIQNKNGVVNFTKSPATTNDAAVVTLKEHNQLLTKEVSEKSLQISQLEKEKSVLVQQLFQARAEINSAGGQADTSIFI